MLGFYNYTVIMTYIGTFFGISGIACVINGNIHSALLCLMAAGFCDMFDGKIASTMKRTVQEKRFGIQIDSLSDLICFGVLPALIVFTASASNAVIFVIAAVYILCALIRLAWFNVDEEERQNSSDGQREYYYGLPVTTSALFLPILLGLGELRGWWLAPLGAVVLAAMSLAFLTPFRIKKPHMPGKVGVLLCGCGELAILLMGVVRL